MKTQHKVTAAVASFVKKHNLLVNDGRVIYNEPHMAMIGHRGPEYTLVIEMVPAAAALLHYYANPKSPIVREGHVTAIYDCDTHFVVELGNFSMNNKALRQSAYMYGLFSQVLAEDGVRVPSIVTNMMADHGYTLTAKGMVHANPGKLDAKRLTSVSNILYSLTVAHDIGLVEEPDFWHVTADGRPTLLAFSLERNHVPKPELMAGLRETFVTVAIASIEEAKPPQSYVKTNDVDGYAEDCFFVIAPNNGKLKLLVDVMSGRASDPVGTVVTMNGENGRVIGTYDFTRDDATAIATYMVADAQDHFAENPLSQAEKDLKQGQSNAGVRELLGKAPNTQVNRQGLNVADVAESEYSDLAEYDDVVEDDDIDYSALID